MSKTADSLSTQEKAGIPKRGILVGLAVLAAFICYIDRVNISVAIIPMQEAFGWSDTTKGFVLSSFFIGYTLFQVPSGWLANRFGGKALLGWAVVIWSVMTILTPPAAHMSLGALIVVRILMGAGETGAFPASYALFGRWIPIAERSRSISALLSGLPLGTLFALAVTGPIVSAYGWPSIFYLFGGFGLVFAVAWVWLIHEEPHRHPAITKAELAKIGQGQTEASAIVRDIPWKKTFTNKPVWALIINHFCSNWIFYVMLSWLPSYFSDALGVSVTSAGLYSIAPWVTMFVMTNATAWVADSLIASGNSVTRVRKVLQVVGLCGAAAFLFIVRTADAPVEAMLLICGALGMLAITWPGYATNHLDIAPRHAGFLFGVTNTAGSMPGVIGVAVTGWLLDVTGTYASAFILASGVSIFGAIVWVLFASGERQI